MAATKRDAALVVGTAVAQRHRMVRFQAFGRVAAGVLAPVAGGGEHALPEDGLGVSALAAGRDPRWSAAAAAGAVAADSGRQELAAAEAGAGGHSLSVSHTMRRY